MAQILETAKVFEAAARSWAKDQPHTVEYLTLLQEQGKRCGMFSSAIPAMVARLLGITTSRPPDDVDLLIASEDFADAAKLLPNPRIIHGKQISVVAGDGQHLRFSADEVVAQIPDEREIQFLSPTTTIQRAGHQYDTRFTDLAIAHRQIIETDYGLVPLAHPMETVAMYGLFQRSEGKNDVRNIAILRGVYNPEDTVYAELRSNEMGLTDREWAFIRSAGSCSLTQEALSLAA